MGKSKEVHYFSVSLFQVKEQQASIEEKFRNELNANIKLSNLYKASVKMLFWMFSVWRARSKPPWLQGAAADAETKSEELSGAVEELHKLLKDAGEGRRKNHTILTPAI